MKIYIGDRLRQKRMFNAMTQSELAKRMHVDARTISSWETNRTEPKPEQIEALAKILNCSYQELTGFSSAFTVDVPAPELNGVMKLYNSLNAEQQNLVLLYMIELSGDN